MKDTKRRFEIFSFFDHTGIRLHLEKMAKKGWLIERITNTGWFYRRIEPASLQFAVSYYPKATAFDPEPTEEEQTFHDFCEHSGWLLAASSAQLQIFYNKNNTPTPIETDPMLEIETIHRAAKKSFLPLYFTLLALFLFQGGLFISRLLSDPIGLLSSAASLFTGFAYTMLFFLCAAELRGYYAWRAKAKKAAERGAFLATKGSSRLQRFILAVVLIGLAYWIITMILTGSNMQRTIALFMLLSMAALFVLINAVRQFLKKKKAPASVNRTITVIISVVLSFAMMGAITFGTLRASQEGWFEPELETYEYNGNTYTLYHDELPLTVEDLLNVEFNGYIREQRNSESLLLANSVMRQHPRMDAENFTQYPSLDYTITAIKAPFLYDMCKDWLLSEQDETDDERIPEGFKNVYEAQDATPWGAQEVYRLVGQDSGPMNRYLLCYEDCIIEIRFDWEPTPEQMAIVGEKLGT